MAGKLAEYEHEHSEARKTLEDLSQRVKTMQQEEQELITVVRGWEAIVAMERKRSGEVGPLFETPVNVAAKEDGEEEGDEEGSNKTEFVRKTIFAARAGISPRDLKTAAKQAGLKHPPSWPYGPLQRLKKSGEIVKRKGRYYSSGRAVNLSLVG